MPADVNTCAGLLAITGAWRRSTGHLVTVGSVLLFADHHDWRKISPGTPPATLVQKLPVVVLSCSDFDDLQSETLREFLVHTTAPKGRPVLRTLSTSAPAPWTRVCPAGALAAGSLLCREGYLSHSWSDPQRSCSQGHAFYARRVSGRDP